MNRSQDYADTTDVDTAMQAIRNRSIRATLTSGHTSCRSRGTAPCSPAHHYQKGCIRIDTGVMGLDEWLPGPVVDRFEDELHVPIVSIHPAAGTYAADFAATLTLADSSTVFVKASTNRVHRVDYEKEAFIAAHLPSGLPTPAIRGWFTYGTWILLWFDAIDGVLPLQPWAPEAVEAVLDTIERRARLLTPCPVPSLPTIAEMIAGNVAAFAVWQDLAVGRPRALSVEKLGSWTRENLDRLADYEAHWAEAVAGESLCHFDPRADNYLIDSDGCAWTVDWSRGCRGAPWVDLATFVLTLAADGYDPEQISNQSAIRGVDSDDVNRHLAAVAGYWNNAVCETRPDRSEGLLDYQQRSATGALTWLRSRMETTTVC